MFPRLPHSHPATAATATIPHRLSGGSGQWRSVLRQADRACCCPAPPVVVVLLPHGPGRPHAVDLLLCRHHYRACRQALAAAGAAAFDPDDAPPDPEHPGQPQPAAAGP